MTRGRLAAAVLVGSVVYAGAVYLVATADLGQPRVLIAVVTVAGLIFTVAGTVAALQRPDNRTGAQMLAVGLLWSLGALQLSQTPLVFTWPNTPRCLDRMLTNGIGTVANAPSASPASRRMRSASWSSEMARGWVTTVPARSMTRVLTP